LRFVAEVLGRSTVGSWWGSSPNGLVVIPMKRFLGGWPARWRLALAHALPAGWRESTEELVRARPPTPWREALRLALGGGPSGTTQALRVILRTALGRVAHPAG